MTIFGVEWVFDVNITPPVPIKVPQSVICIEFSLATTGVHDNIMGNPITRTEIEITTVIFLLVYVLGTLDFEAILLMKSLNILDSSILNFIEKYSTSNRVIITINNTILNCNSHSIENPDVWISVCNLEIIMTIKVFKLGPVGFIEEETISRMSILW